VLREFDADKQAALEAIGIVAESYAKRSAPVDTGTLRNSISHAVKENDVYIGTNQPYAAFVEYGTGIYASDGQGRQSPWGYYDRDGKYHVTRGQKPHHMLKKAATEHNDEYKAILKGRFK
jgi:HK97 gp10 family phage protein